MRPSAIFGATGAACLPPVQRDLLTAAEFDALAARRAQNAARLGHAVGRWASSGDEADAEAIMTVLAALVEDEATSAALRLRFTTGPALRSGGDALAAAFGSAPAARALLALASAKLGRARWLASQGLTQPDEGDRRAEAASLVLDAGSAAALGLAALGRAGVCAWRLATPASGPPGPPPVGDASHPATVAAALVRALRRCDGRPGTPGPAAVRAAEGGLPLALALAASAGGDGDASAGDGALAADPMPRLSALMALPGARGGLLGPGAKAELTPAVAELKAAAGTRGREGAGAASASLARAVASALAAARRSSSGETARARESRASLALLLCLKSAKPSHRRHKEVFVRGLEGAAASLGPAEPEAGGAGPGAGAARSVGAVLATPAEAEAALRALSAFDSRLRSAALAALALRPSRPEWVRLAGLLAARGAARLRAVSPSSPSMVTDAQAAWAVSTLAPAASAGGTAAAPAARLGPMPPSAVAFDDAAFLAASAPGVPTGLHDRLGSAPHCFCDAVDVLARLGDPVGADVASLTRVLVYARKLPLALNLARRLPSARLPVLLAACEVDTHVVPRAVSRAAKELCIPVRALPAYRTKVWRSTLPVLVRSSNPDMVAALVHEWLGGALMGGRGHEALLEGLAAGRQECHWVSLLSAAAEAARRGADGTVRGGAASGGAGEEEGEEGEEEEEAADDDGDDDDVDGAAATAGGAAGVKPAPAAAAAPFPADGCPLWLRCAEEAYGRDLPAVSLLLRAARDWRTAELGAGSDTGSAFVSSCRVELLSSGGHPWIPAAGAVRLVSDAASLARFVAEELAGNRLPAAIDCEWRVDESAMGGRAPALVASLSVGAGSTAAVLDMVSLDREEGRRPADVAAAWAGLCRELRRRVLVGFAVSNDVVVVSSSYPWSDLGSGADTAPPAAGTPPAPARRACTVFPMPPGSAGATPPPPPGHGAGVVVPSAPNAAGLTVLDLQPGSGQWGADTLPALAAALGVGTVPASLSRLVRAASGTPLPKSWQICDWRARPLSDAKLAYAAGDACVVLRILALLRDRGAIAVPGLDD